MNIGFDFKVNSCKAKGDGALYELVGPFLKCVKSYNKVTILNFKTNSCKEGRVWSTVSMFFHFEMYNYMVTYYPITLDCSFLAGLFNRHYEG